MNIIIKGNENAVGFEFVYKSNEISVRDLDTAKEIALALNDATLAFHRKLGAESFSRLTLNKVLGLHLSNSKRFKVPEGVNVSINLLNEDSLEVNVIDTKKGLVVCNILIKETFLEGLKNLIITEALERSICLH